MLPAHEEYLKKNVEKQTRDKKNNRIIALIIENKFNDMIRTI